MVDGNPTVAEFEQIVKVCDGFERQWRRGERPRIAEFIDRNPSLPRSALFRELLALELELAPSEDNAQTVDDYRAAFPDLIPVLEAVFAGDEASTSGPETDGPVATDHSPQGSAKSPCSPQPDKIGRYTVLSLLDEGGQGRVFRVVHPDLRKDLVLKLAARPVADDPPGRGRLAAEGRLLADLDHPNLVRVFDLDVDENGRPFLVMEHVAGCTLDRHIKSGLPAPRRAAAMVAEIARAVGYVHLRGVVHQDIKPRNVLIDERGRPRLIDFGLARLHHAWADEPVGPIGGTLIFMAPEQARGEVERVGPPADIYALGALLYFLLTGQSPVSGGNRSKTYERARRGAVDVSALKSSAAPRRLRRICLKALSPEPADRYATADELADELERALRRFFLYRPIAVVSLAVVAILSIALLATRSRLPHSAVPVDPRPPGSNAHSELAVPPRILAFDVKQFRGKSPLQSIGTIGKSSDETRCGDTLRVLVRFDSPVYCYLIALNPDGTVQPCHPAETTEQPPRVKEVGYPTGATEYFKLSDGPGLQGFLVLASLKPLPPYSQWSPREGLHWKHVDSDVVWSFDGRWIQRISRENRGVVTTNSDAPKPFQEVCDSLPNLDGIEVMQVIAFPVKPKD